MKQVITSFVIGDTEVAAMNVLPNNLKMLWVKIDSSFGPKTITAPMLHSPNKLFVTVMNSTANASYSHLTWECIRF